jgi:cytochrome P450
MLSTDAELPVTHGDLMDFTRDPIGLMRRLVSKHGDVAALDDGEQRIVFAFGPEHNRTVQCDPRFHSRFFAIRGPKKSAQRRTTCGLLNMNGDTHRRHRRMAMGPFTRRAIPNYHPTVSSLITELLETWQVGEVRDLHADMTAFMLRVTSAILFGLSDRELAYETGHLIDEWAHMNHELGMGVLVSSPEILDGYDKLLALAERLEKNIRQMIENRRDQEPGDDILSLLIQARDGEGGVTDDELIGHVSLIFGAAHLTTAHTLTWTQFLLAQHPTVAREVDAEVRGATFEADVPTPEEASKLPFLERALKESMRCLPASAYLQRMVAEPVELGPFQLGRGSAVIFSQYMTHHMPRLYDAPDEFRPERWKMIDPSPYEYLPFGSGPRMCIGAMLAMQTLMTTLPSILRRFRLAVVPDSEISGEVVSTMLGPRTSVPVQLCPADGRFESAPVWGNIHDLVTLRELPKIIRRAA